MHATEGTWPAGRRAADFNRWVDRWAISSVCLVLAIAAFLVSRRLTGNLSAPLPTASLLAFAAAITGWAICIQLGLRRLKAARFWLPCIVIVLLAFACSYPGGRIVDWLSWSLAAILVATASLFLHAPGHFLPPTDIATSSAPTVPDQQLQQLVRYRHLDGSESVHGKLLAEFQPGERTTTLYIGFCPPFEWVPEIELEVDNSYADAKVAQVLHNGAQIDLRRPHSLDAIQCVTVEFVATARPSVMA
jgi:hypothetical protein